MYPVFLVNSKKLIEGFTYRTGDKPENYVVKKENDGECVVDITCMKGHACRGKIVSVDDNLENKIRHAIKFFSYYINLSALNRSVAKFEDDY